MFFREQNLLHSYLPRTDDINEINSSDEELKIKIPLLLRTIKRKVNETKEWTKEDYTKFYIRLSKMEVKTFKETFVEMLFLLTLPKDKLKMTLEQLDEKADTYVFDKKKIGIDTDKASSTFQYSNVIDFLCGLMSKFHKYGRILTNHYSSYLKASNTIAEEQEKIASLYNMLEERNPDVIEILTLEYYKWAEPISKDPIIGDLVNRMLEQIIQYNKENLRQKYNELENKKMREIIQYQGQINRRKYNNQAKDRVKLHRYRCH